MRFAGVEGGGTSWKVAISIDTPENIVVRQTFATTTPEETLGNIRKWLQSQDFDAIGIASFGPICPKPDDEFYGFITSTPKPGWCDTNVIVLLGLKDEFKAVPCVFDTDVNAPALAEYNSSVYKYSSIAYITVGTGIGVGLVVNGESVKGMLHSEAGHMMIQKMEGDTIDGCCPYHVSCVEGLAAIGALANRKNCPASELPSIPDSDFIWDIEAFYLAQLCCNLILTVAPEHISLGGGVLERHCLLPKVRMYVRNQLNNYIRHPNLTPDGIDNYITLSKW